MKSLLKKLGYVKGEPLQFLSKRVCGVWLIWISVILLIGTLLGGTQKINMPIFDFGYFLGILLILGNKSLYKRIAFGSPSKFQKNMIFASIILMFVLLVLMGGPNFATHNYRMIWLAAFLAIGIHFVPFSIVHGKIMLPIAVLVSINALLGMILKTVDFAIFAYIDISIKCFFGLVMVFSANPLSEVKSTTVKM